MSLIPTNAPCCSSNPEINNTTCSAVESFLYSPAGLAVAMSIGIVLASLFWILLCTCCICCWSCCCKRGESGTYTTEDEGPTVVATDMRYLSMGRNRNTLTQMIRNRISNSSIRQQARQSSTGNQPDPTTTTTTTTSALGEENETYMRYSQVLDD